MKARTEAGTGRLTTLQRDVSDLTAARSLLDRAVEAFKANDPVAGLDAARCAVRMVQLVQHQWDKEDPIDLDDPKAALEAAKTLVDLGEYRKAAKIIKQALTACRELAQGED